MRKMNLSVTSTWRSRSNFYPLGALPSFALGSKPTVRAGLMGLAPTAASMVLIR